MRKLTFTCMLFICAVDGAVSAVIVFVSNCGGNVGAGACAGDGGCGGCASGGGDDVIRVGVDVIMVAACC